MGAGRWASGQNGGVCLQKGQQKTHPRGNAPAGMGAAFLYGFLLDLYPDPLRAGEGATSISPVFPPDRKHFLRKDPPAASLIPYY